MYYLSSSVINNSLIISSYFAERWVKNFPFKTAFKGSEILQKSETKFTAGTSGHLPVWVADLWLIKTLFFLVTIVYQYYIIITVPLQEFLKVFFLLMGHVVCSFFYILLLLLVSVIGILPMGVGVKTCFLFQVIFFSLAVSPHPFSLPFTTAHLWSSQPFFFNTLLSLWSSFSRELKFLPSLQSHCHISSNYMINQEATINISSHHPASDRQKVPFDASSAIVLHCQRLPS